MSETLTEDKQQTISLKDDRFALAMANGADKFKALDISGYQAKTKGSRAVQISKLLKATNVQAKIKEYQTEIMLAKGITDDRIVGNIAEIAFNRSNNNVDRNRALETLCRQRGMLTDKFQDTTTDHQRELTASEQQAAADIAAYVNRQSIKIANKA